MVEGNYLAEQIEKMPCYSGHGRLKWPWSMRRPRQWRQCGGLAWWQRWAHRRKRSVIRHPKNPGPLSMSVSPHCWCPRGAVRGHGDGTPPPRCPPELTVLQGNEEVLFGEEHTFPVFACCGQCSWTSSCSWWPPSQYLSGVSILQIPLLPSNQAFLLPEAEPRLRLHPRKTPTQL